GGGLDEDWGGAGGGAGGGAVGGEELFKGGDGKGGAWGVEIFARDADPAAEAARPAGVLDQLVAQEPRGKFALDDLDRRDHGVALVDGDRGRAVLRRARAGAAGDDLVLHVALAGIGAAPAEDDRAAAGAVGAHLVGDDVGERVVDRIDQGVHGRVIGIHRRREARIEHAAFARRDGKGAQQALAYEGRRIDQRDQAIGASRLYQRWA